MKKFSLGSVVYIALVLIGTWLTYGDNRPSDGQLSLGFPLPFYHGGGFCMGPCGPYFYGYPFILDVLFLILPIMAVYLYLKRKKSITK